MVLKQGSHDWVQPYVHSEGKSCASAASRLWELPLRFTCVVLWGRQWFILLLFLLDNFKCPIKEEIALTGGEWEVLARHGSKVGAIFTLSCSVRALHCLPTVLACALCYTWEQLELFKLHFVSLFIAASAFPRSAVVRCTLNRLPF